MPATQKQPADDAPLSVKELRRCLQGPRDIRYDLDATVPAATLARARQVLLGKPCLGGCGVTFTKAVRPAALVYAAPALQGLCADCADTLDTATIIDLQNERLRLDLEAAKAARKQARQGWAAAIAHGDIVPKLDADGNPVLRAAPDGSMQTVYIAPQFVAEIAAIQATQIAETVEWLKHNNAADPAARDYLCAAYPGLSAGEADAIVRRARQIRRGET